MRLVLEEREVFMVMYLDTRLGLIDVDKMFFGTLNQTEVHPREIVKAVLKRNAHAVIFSHNHPSGSPEPSRSDILLTGKLVDALRLIDVRVLDHIIVAGNLTVSMAARGLM